MLGERIGQPDLPYVQLADAEMANALVGARWPLGELCRPLRRDDTRFQREQGSSDGWTHHPKQHGNGLRGLCRGTGRRLRGFTFLSQIY